MSYLVAECFCDSGMNKSIHEAIVRVTEGDCGVIESMRNEKRKNHCVPLQVKGTVSMDIVVTILKLSRWWSVCRMLFMMVSMLSIVFQLAHLLVSQSMQSADVSAFDC